MVLLPIMLTVAHVAPILSSTTLIVGLLTKSISVIQLGEYAVLCCVGVPAPWRFPHIPVCEERLVASGGEVGASVPRLQGPWWASLESSRLQNRIYYGRGCC